MTSPRDRPIDSRSSGGAQARQDWIRQRLAGTGSITIDEACAALGASGMTIRRDLAVLEALGDARRIRGGAQALGPSPFRSRSPRNARAKVVIAEKVRPMVPEVGAIALDSSSTMSCVAHLLTSARDLLVVTNGFETFDALQNRPGIRVVLTGGERDPRTSSLVGPTAEMTAGAFRYDAVFLSAAAMEPRHGTMESTPEEAAVKQIFATQADRVVMGVDASKLGHTAPVVSLRWGRIDRLVTELHPESDALREVPGGVEIR